MPDLDPSEMKGRRLGRVLTKMGKVTREQVHAALAKQPSLKKKLGEVLVEMGLVTPRDIAVAVAGHAPEPGSSRRSWRTPTWPEVSWSRRPPSPSSP